jgi:hypothetical protein
MVNAGARRPNSGSATAAAAHFDLHERVQLPREPQPGGGPDRAHRLRAGTFINADLDKASEDNERNSLHLDAERRIGVVQIAGLVARRIVSFVREGQTIGAGERFGMIRFGSRVDVYLPEGTKSLVAPKARPRLPARPFWPISGLATAADLPRRTIRTISAGRPADRRNGGAGRRLLYIEAMQMPVDPKSSGNAPPPVSPDPGADAGAQRHHAAGDLRRADRDPPATEGGWNGRWRRSCSPPCSTASTAASRA